MKTTRTIKELLQLMLNHREFFTEGLCGWKSKLFREGLINFEEYFLLKKYIKKNKPSMFSSWYTFKSRFIALYSSYYWAPQNIEPRIKWLKTHISKL